MSLQNIIKPIMTEKSFLLAQKGQFTFHITPSATKTTVKQAVQDLFKVDVINVRIINLPKKSKKSGKKRLTTFSASRKKAVVTLKAGQSIEYFQLPDDDKKKSKSKAKKSILKPTPKKPTQKRGFFGLGKRKEQRTQDK
ncbi:50S ribosomal protein L23 [Patescibacteria group bacterium]